VNPRPTQSGPEDADETGLTSFRVGRLEQQLSELVTRSEGWHTTLGAQITALSNQIGTGLASLPDHYTPRREAEERHRGIDERFDALERRMDDREKSADGRFKERAADVDRRVAENTGRISRMEGAGWGFALMLLATLAAALAAYFKPH
jgi:hypothetical protein